MGSLASGREQSSAFYNILWSPSWNGRVQVNWMRVAKLYAVLFRTKYTFYAWKIATMIYVRTAAPRK